MKIHAIALAAALASASVAFAQAPAPAEDVAAAPDCVKRHDHGAERQVPTPGKGCISTARVAKAKPQVKSKAIQGHDHGKVHKGQ